jgi:hypothetical protein
MYTSMVPTQQRAELVTLVKDELNNMDPAKLTIDTIIPEGVLHTFKDEDVLSVAYDYGFQISACCKDRVKYRANGVWLKPSEGLAAKLASYENLSHGYCNTCENEFRKEMERKLYSAGIIPAAKEAAMY